MVHLRHVNVNRYIMAAAHLHCYWFVNDDGFHPLHGYRYRVYGAGHSSRWCSMSRIIRSKLLDNKTIVKTVPNFVADKQKTRSGTFCEIGSGSLLQGHLFF